MKVCSEQLAYSLKGRKYTDLVQRLDQIWVPALLLSLQPLSTLKATFMLS